MKTLREILIFFGIEWIIVEIWQILEYIILGEIKPNNIDCIIAVILGVSLYYNLRRKLESE